jgi:hypothetical protein
MSRSVKEVSAKSYISTEAYNANFFTYTVTTGPSPQFKKTGALTLVSGATSVNCPAGNILRENGKKLFPSAYPGVTDYMVGVFDILNNLSGFIDPNDPVFAPFNGDRPNYLKDSVNSQVKNLGAPVFTLGDVTTGGDVNAAGDVVSQNVYSRADIGVGGRLVLNSGNTGIMNFPAANSVDASGNPTFKKVTVAASNCRVGSIVMLTYTGLNTPGVLSAEVITNGSFQIVSTNPQDKGSVMYLIVN